MAGNYKEILKQAEQEKEKQKALKQENRQVGNHASIQAGSAGEEELVNLCVRVPKSWRTKVKAAAVSHDVSLGELVVEAIDRYLEQKNWL